MPRKHVARCSALILLTALLLTACGCEEWSGSSGQVPLPGNPSVPEIEDFSLNDVARVSVDAFGNPFILYNPSVVAQLGPALSTYFEYHEYGHVYLHSSQLGALQVQFQVNPYLASWSSHSIELEADCYATEAALHLGQTGAVEAAIAFFQSTYSPPTATHPAGITRASQVIRCRDDAAAGNGRFQF